tara:strand:+ start:359 stop:529 length:171 start_codon:yes stop_codon:yes gene_type:complete
MISCVVEKKISLFLTRAREKKAENTKHTRSKEKDLVFTRALEIPAQEQNRKHTTWG